MPVASVPGAQLMDEPKIDEQNRVTFTINAPNAKSVKVINQSDEMAMGAAEYDLKKDEIMEKYSALKFELNFKQHSNKN